MGTRAATCASFGLIARRTYQSATVPRPNPFGHIIKPIVFFPRWSNELSKKHFTYNHKSQDKNNVGSKDEKFTPSQSKSRIANASLRRIGVEAQRPRNSNERSGRRTHIDPGQHGKDVTVYCAAETYEITAARDLMIKEGYDNIDPCNSGLFPQVLHIQIPSPDYAPKDLETPNESPNGAGDIFIFPAGSVVTWNVPPSRAEAIIHHILPSCASGSHLSAIETEDLSYIEDPTRETSKIIGDTIILGTASTPTSTQPETHPETEALLAKIAFSSALARSAKLSVLENALNAYFSTTRSIPAILSSGRKLRFTRAFILRKTGELLNIRAQLNIYSELTDSLPDLFWDSPYELGLEGYYEQLGKALDVNVRIKVLNERMDYAREIAEVLRERLSEKHSTGLEWLIIGLISIEVAFGVMHLWKERSEKMDPDSTEILFKQWLEKELAKSE